MGAAAAMMLSFSIIKDVVLFVLAIYGAGLSTFNLVHAARRDKRRVSARISTVMPTYGAAVGPCYAKIEAVNIGHRPVTVTTLTLELPGRGKLLLLQADRLSGVPDTRLPAVLADGESAQLYFPYADLGRAINDAGYAGKTAVVPYCEDSVGNSYRGKPWEVDPATFARM